MAEFRFALRQTAPVLCGYLFLGLAFGLLTFALFLGSLPVLLLLPQPSGTLACAAGAVCSLPLLLLGLRLEVGRC